MEEDEDTGEEDVVPVDPVLFSNREPIASRPPDVLCSLPPPNRPVSFPPPKISTSASTIRINLPPPDLPPAARLAEEVLPLPVVPFCLAPPPVTGGGVDVAGRCARVEAGREADAGRCAEAPGRWAEDVGRWDPAAGRWEEPAGRWAAFEAWCCSMAAPNKAPRPAAPEGLPALPVPLAPVPAEGLALPDTFWKGLPAPWKGRPVEGRAALWLLMGLPAAGRALWEGAPKGRAPCAAC